MSNLIENVKDTIRDVPDFPKPGILFKDITPVLARPDLMNGITDYFAESFAGAKVDVVVGMESRGFIFGTPLAMALGAAFAPARKPGKLPWKSIGYEYDLEYGTNRLEMHTDAIKPGQRVLICDDLLATGGTAQATAKLVEQLGGELVGFAFVIELGFLKGGDKLGGVRVDSLVVY
jgi:adenine phosphoribosyltransferase